MQGPRSTRLPGWCAPPPEALAPHDILDDALAEIAASREGPIALTGPPGAGTTSAAGAVLEALAASGVVGRVAAVTVDALTERPDLVLALGAALDATLPGDEASLIEALHRGPAIAVLIDDADLAPDAVQHVLALSSSVLWILTGRQAVAGREIPVPPLSDDRIAALAGPGREPAAYRGRPLLAALAPGIDPNVDWSGAALDAWPELRLLADLPMGLGPVDGPLPPAAVRDVEGRVVPRRSFREALGLAARPAAGSLARAVERRAAELHRLACDLDGEVRPEEIRLLRTASRAVVDRQLATLATAAAARLHLRCFQASDALELIRAHERASRPSRLGRGLLRWLEGDALLTQGSVDLAHRAHEEAERDLRAVGGEAARVMLARRCADQWAARGVADRAHRWLAVARDALGPHSDPRSLADVLRIRANLAARAGELVGASALYDEALATLKGLPDAERERAFILVGQAAIALSRGALDDAADAIRRADDDARGHPLAEAAVRWRRSELALRRGDIDDAYEALAEAIDAFRRAGSLRGLLLCARMEGDLAALSGDRQAAIVAWRYAIALSLRTRNLHVMRRLLERLLAVEREGLPGPHIDEIASQLESVDALLAAS